jgi:hypothetical protein
VNQKQCGALRQDRDIAQPEQTSQMGVSGLG